MLYDAIEAAEASIAEWLEEHAERVSADRLGLDERCGMLWVCDEAVVCDTHSRGRLDYYGGFEYVDKEAVRSVGRYTIYMADEESGRVQECIERFHEAA